MFQFDSIAAEYARHRRADDLVARRLTLKANPGFTILEVGCGTGNYIAAMHDAVGCSCWAIDPSPEMLAEAKKKCSDAITFQIGRAEALEFAAERFDLVFSVDVVHHVSDRRAYFQEAYRVLRPGGQLCTVTESEEMIRQRVHSRYFPSTVEIELARYPTTTALREIMADSGFREITEEVVESSSRITDIARYREKAFSCLHLIAEDAFQQGIAKMEEDLNAEPIQVVSHSLILCGTK